MAKSGHIVGAWESALVLAPNGLSKKPNLLLLDEPTNHLDSRCMRHGLNIALKVFEGFAYFWFSHDRLFIVCGVLMIFTWW